MDVTITVPLKGIQEIVRALGARPYDDVAMLIQSIAKQVQDQIQAGEAKPVRELS